MTRLSVEFIRFVRTNCDDALLAEQVATKTADDATHPLAARDGNDARTHASKANDVILGNIDPFSVHGTPAGM